MPSITEAKKHWRQLDQFHSLTHFKLHVSSHAKPLITAGLRSVCWKIFFVFHTLDRASWPTQLARSRRNYQSLRVRHLYTLQHPHELQSSTDPLSEAGESPWVALRADEHLRAEILQDIERCMPDNLYFRQPTTQDTMLDMLFIWCKLHPTIGYRQGMHELLAPLLWVVERDAIDMDVGGADSADQTLADTLDSHYIEHDTYALFSAIMGAAKLFYAPPEPGSPTLDSPMLIRSSRIFHTHLPKIDPELSAHLIKLEIVPQIFLLRWIRLLFGREFPLDSVLAMWDALFAIDPSLELVDMISIAMLLRIRWELMAADTNHVFSLLLGYPEPTTPASAFVKDALYLRDHPNSNGGFEIMSRYGKRASVMGPERTLVSSSSPPPPSSLSSWARHNVGLPKSFASQQGAGMEALLQSAAKNVLELGSQWGVGKMFRDTVGEVKKKAESHQGNGVGQTISTSGRRGSRKSAQASHGQLSHEQVYLSDTVRTAEEMEKSNQVLAHMLEVAVNDLWEFHKLENERQMMLQEDERQNSDMDALSLAIAKVQFVQIHLQGFSLSLATDEAVEHAKMVKTAADAATPEPCRPTRAENEGNDGPTPAAAAATPPDEQLAISTTRTPRPSTLPSVLPQDTVLPPSTTSTAILSPRSRPRLTSSNFSWMLGEGSATSSFASGTAHSTFSSEEKRRMKGKGFLFGDEDDDDNGGNGGSTVNPGSRSNGKGGKNAKGKHAANMDVREEVIDLDNVGSKGNGSVA